MKDALYHVSLRRSQAAACWPGSAGIPACSGPGVSREEAGWDACAPRPNYADQIYFRVLISSTSLMTSLFELAIVNCGYARPSGQANSCCSNQNSPSQNKVSPESLGVFSSTGCIRNSRLVHRCDGSVVGPGETLYWLPVQFVAQPCPGAERIAAALDGQRARYQMG